MCLGSGTSKPALQQRTLPAEGVTPADESVKKSRQNTPQPEKAGDERTSLPGPLAWVEPEHQAAKGAKKTNTADPGLNL